MKSLRLTPAAWIDLREITAHIAVDNPAAATRFFDSALLTFEQLRTYPLLGTTRPLTHKRLRDVRFHRVKSYRSYVIAYRVTARAVIVVRVIHAARDYPTLF